MVTYCALFLLTWEFHIPRLNNGTTVTKAWPSEDLISFNKNNRRMRVESHGQIISQSQQCWQHDWPVLVGQPFLHNPVKAQQLGDGVQDPRGTFHHGIWKELAVWELGWRSCLSCYNLVVLTTTPASPAHASGSIAPLSSFCFLFSIALCSCQ